MCGIAGIVAAPGARVSGERLARMRDAMAHRGPDGAGSWSDPRGGAALAHRRLAIVDLSDAGAQPMSTEDGRFHLTYNGEVYNHVALRRELEALGHRFRGRSDTEAVLRGFAQWGEGVLHRLVGMFAFAVWDTERAELFIARDRMGVKPVCFAVDRGDFVFASELRAIVAGGMTAEADPTAAWHYLTFLVPPAPLTAYRGIYKLPAGHVLRFAAGGEPRLARWWDPSASAPPDVAPETLGDPDAAAAELLRRLDRSIERRMMSDVPFGVFLSGGVDSSTNVALMSRHLDRPVDTFSVGFRGNDEYDELDYARLVSRRFGTRHREVRVGEDDLLAYVPRMIEDQDEPLADWVNVPLHFVSDLARESGVEVVQLGEGADELLCGYDHFRAPLDVERRYGRTLRALPAPARDALVAAARGAGRWSPAWARRAAIAAAVAAGGEIFRGGAVALSDGGKRRVWNGTEPRGAYPEFVPEAFAGPSEDGVVREVMAPFRAANPGAGFYQNMLYLELRFRLPELLLMRVDKIAMASSVEGRDPYLDQDVVAFCMALPQDFRLRGTIGKWLLKRAVRGLVPDAVLDRPKMGFGAPVATWLRGSLGEWARARLEESDVPFLRRAEMVRLLDDHRAGVANRSLEIWTLLDYVLWHRTRIEGRSL